jgi:hypothetical protein
MTPDQFARIKLLHQEFETMGMMHEDWGVMAHEHRGKLIARVEELERLAGKLREIILGI